MIFDPVLSSLAETLQSRIIGYQPVDNIDVLSEIYGNTTSFFSTDLIGEYFTSQGTLLCACVLLILLAGIAAVLLVLFLVGRFVCGACGAERYQVCHKHPTNVGLFVFLMCSFLILWLILSFNVTSMILTASALKGRFPIPEERLNIDYTFTGTPADRHVIIRLDSVLIDDSSASAAPEVDEMEQLSQFKNVRELGYEFQFLESDSAYTGQSLVFWLLSLFFAGICVLTGVVICLGTWQYMISYHPMDRSVISNYCGLWAIGTAVCLFFVIPLVLVLTSVFLVYSHMYESICPVLQTLSQNQHMEDYVNAHFSSFDANNLVAFLNDLLPERLELNEHTCSTFIAPVERLYMAAFLSALASTPLIFVLIAISRYFLKMDTKYYWTQHETYSTIPDREKGKPIPIMPTLPTYLHKY